MIKTFLAIFFIFSATICFAQNKSAKTASRPDSVGYYMHDDHNMAYSEASAKFVRLLIKADSNMFRVNDYYMDGTPKLIAKTTVDSLDFFAGIRGICYEYYPNGKRKSIKNYENGKLVGDAVTYYSNGNLYNITTYSGQTIYLKQCFDSVANNMATDGNGTWINLDVDDMHDFITGPVINGKEDGVWKRKMGDTILTITYKEGKVIAGEENLKVQQKFEKVEQVPTFPGGDYGFSKYISSNIKYPAIARDNNVQGKVIVLFVVEKDGSLTDIKVVRGIGSGCDQEAVRVISKSPKWKPGTINGKTVRVAYSVPIEFSLRREPFPEQPADPSNRRGYRN